jgi:hypothetical protein
MLLPILAGLLVETVTMAHQEASSDHELPLQNHPAASLWDPSDEVPDEKLLDCMLRAGCFDYLFDPAENIYTLDDGHPL